MVNKKGVYALTVFAVIMILISIGIGIGIGIPIGKSKTMTEVEIVEKIETVEVEKPVEVIKYVVVTEDEVPKVENLGTFKATAYCPCEKCCGIYASGYTATGTLATEGRTIAVDPNVIPYGTHVIINGHEYIAEDCGGAIDGNRIDIFFDSHQDALKWGVQQVEVFVMKEG